MSNYNWIDWWLINFLTHLILQFSRICFCIARSEISKYYPVLISLLENKFLNLRDQMVVKQFNTSFDTPIGVALATNV